MFGRGIGADNFLAFARLVAMFVAGGPVVALPGGCVLQLGTVTCDFGLVGTGGGTSSNL